LHTFFEPRRAQYFLTPLLAQTFVRTDFAQTRKFLYLEHLEPVFFAAQTFFVPYLVQDLRILREVHLVQVCSRLLRLGAYLRHLGILTVTTLWLKWQWFFLPYFRHLLTRLPRTTLSACDPASAEEASAMAAKATNRKRIRPLFIPENRSTVWSVSGVEVE